MQLFKTIISGLVSTRTMGVMLLLYALAMAMATFVENDYGTPVAKALIYNSWWFELIMVILVINFLGNIKRYQLHRRGKWPLLAFHLAFILLFIGGAITRYISFEGSMHIREGQASNQIVSEGTFLKVQITDGRQTLAYQDLPLILTSSNVPTYLKPFQRNKAADYDFHGKRLRVQVLDFIPRAQDSLRPSPNGRRVLHLVALENGRRQNKYLASGSVQLIQGKLVSYNKETSGAINLSDAGDSLQIMTPVAGSYMTMATQVRGDVGASAEKQPFHLRSLYNLDGLAFVVPQLPERGEIVRYEGDKRTNEADPDLVTMALSTGGTTDTVAFYGGRGYTGFQHQAQLAGLTVSLGYGSTIYQTPFALRLQKFKLEKYPGSNSPASYASDVQILDGAAETPYTIFMNHVLDHQGYRFFQSSYDSDEKGTILSVNHDFWGTTITYAGYFLLFLGMFVTLFWKGTRFSKLNNQLKTLSRATAVVALLLGSTVAGLAQEIDMHGPSEGDQLRQPQQAAPGQPPATLQVPTQIENAAEVASTVRIDRDHAERFGSLLVQNFDGRIEPVNTLALEILRKLYHKDRFYALDANQFLLSASTEPITWARMPVIKVGTKGGPQLMRTVQANADGYTSLVNLIRIGDDGQPHFILEADYQRAFARKASEQDNYDKELIELNDKLQVLQYLLTGQYLRVLPVPNDPNNTWIAWGSELAQNPGTGSDLYGAYLKEVITAGSSDDWSKADGFLQQLKDNQKRLAGHILPSEAKVNWEIRYNSWNIFFKLMIAYALLGTLILALAFTRLFTESRLVKRLISGLLVLVMAGALIQATGLGVRWYISGHEPWSNGYEAVMFISWTGIVAGLMLYRNSNAFIPAAGCLIAVILMGFAHGGSQMNPQITPLVPVLKSYWLMIHVAIITSSYGFFGLSALIGLVVLLLYIINNRTIEKKLVASVNELTIVNEMSLTVGLFLLTVGTFLGGMWANESWGRYWSWDPKETWAFISVIVYAFVLHLRLIPKLQGKYLFNLLSLLSFSSVIMTYFGVNYYLSGLHSYAKGDPVPIPVWVYITVALISVVAVCSYLRYAKWKNTRVKPREAVMQ